MAKRKTNNEFLNELKEISNGKLIALSEYGKNSSEKVKFKCLECDHEFEARPYHILSKTNPTGCPKCRRKQMGLRNTLTKDEVERRVKEIDNGEYTIIDWLDYKGTRSKVRFKHIKCGHEFEMMLNNFLNKGQRCPNHRYDNCKLFTSKSHGHYVKKIQDNCIDHEEYTFLEEFKGARVKVKVKHNICGHEYEVTPQKFIDGRRCPHCAKFYSSTPIKWIKKFLNENNLDFESEKTFDDLRSPLTNYLLRFDIYIPSINTVIEYDGEFHDSIIDGRNNEESLNRQKLYDEIKDKYCNDNGIIIKRIHYRDKKNMKKILTDFISSTTIETTSTDGRE